MAIFGRNEPYYAIWDLKLLKALASRDTRTHPGNVVVLRNYSLKGLPAFENSQSQVGANVIIPADVTNFLV